jgi:DNA repair exonuclease SbcCD ATPase subunit
MKIIELRASSFARLRAIEIRPNGALVPITGKNREGKTSVLNAIWAALKGRTHAPAKPIHNDAQQATVLLDLGSLTIIRTFKRGKDGQDYTTDLIVRDKDGGRVTRSPQALIDAMLGDLSFDPLAFARAPVKEQFETLRKLVPAFDFEAHTRKRAEAYESRTAINRSAKRAIAAAAMIQPPPGPEPEPVDVAALTDKLEATNEQNAEIEQMTRQAAEHKHQAEQLLDEAEELRSRATMLEQRAAGRQQEAGIITAAFSRLVWIDTRPILAAINSAQAVEAVRREFAKRREWEKVAADDAEESARLTAEIEAIDARVREAIADARLPAGLALQTDETGGQVTLNGIPFAQAATSEKILASAQVGMAMSPDLRVMLVDEGSELDSETLTVLDQLASERDWQIWLTKIQEGEGGVGFRIEDGSVVDAERKRELVKPPTQRDMRNL